MYIGIVKIVFSILALMFVILFSIRAFYNFKDLGKLSAFVSVIAMFLLLYVLTAFVLAFLLPNYVYKLIILLFGVSPFIIGKIVTYQKLKMYSIIQILCVILSVGFVMFI